MVIKGGSSEVYSSFLNDVIKSVPSLSSEDVSLSQGDMIQLINSISQLDFVDNIYFNGAEDNLIFSDNKFIAPVSNETTEEHLKNLGNSDDEVRVIDTSVDTVIQSLRERSKTSLSEGGVSQNTSTSSGVNNESETDVLLNLFKSVTPNGYFNEQQKMLVLEDDIKQGYQLDTEDEIIEDNSEESYINDDEDESVEESYINDDEDESVEESYINDDEDEPDFKSADTDVYSDDDEDEEYEPDDTLSYRNIEDVSLTVSTEMSEYIDDEDDEENNELIPDSSNNIQEMGYNNISSINGEKGVLNSVTIQDNLDNESSVYPAYFNSEDGVENFVSVSSSEEEEYEDDDEDSDSGSSSDSYFDDDDEEEIGGNNDTLYVDDDDEGESEDTDECSNSFSGAVSYSTDNYLDDDDDEGEDEVPKYNTTFDDSYLDDDDSDEEESTFSTQGNLGTDNFNNSEDIVDNFDQSLSSSNQKIVSNVREETSDDKLANSIARLAEGVIKLPRTIKKGIRSARDYMRVDDNEISENNIIQKRGN